MNSIRNYEQDSSAMGRINAWGMAVNLALDRPLVGGGFECFTPRAFAVYARDPTRVVDAHSVYFKVLGEHGFVGIALFLTLAGLTWRSCARIHRRTRHHEDLRWMSELARMIQVSMVGWATAGAFVGLAYFDLYYDLIAAVVVTKLILRDELAKKATAPRLGWGPEPSPAVR